MNQSWLIGAFLLSVAALGYTFVGYALHIAAMARLAKRRSVRETGHSSRILPEITVVLVAYNESMRICARVENLLASDYPADRLRVLVVSDGSTDDTVASIPADPRIRVLDRKERHGKPSCLNAGVAAATTEIIVFADARQRFEPEAIRALAVNFHDPAVGAVSGALEISRAGSNTGAGIDVYWRLEKWIRASEAVVDSAIGCTGAIYAIRRALFQPIPPDTILDDVLIPMQVTLQGSRVLFEASAVAWDPQALEPQAEQRRKKRTLAGNFQLFFRHLGWFLPWRNRLVWQLVGHKVLRLAAPGFLLAAFASNATLLASPLFRWCFAGQCGLYLAAACAPILPRTRFLAIPAGFVFLNLMTLRGFWYYLVSDDLQRWDRADLKPKQ